MTTPGGPHEGHAIDPEPSDSYPSYPVAPSPFTQRPPEGWADTSPSLPPKQRKYVLPWALALVVTLVAGVTITALVIQNTKGHNHSASGLSIDSKPMNVKKYLLANSDVPADWEESLPAEELDTHIVKADNADCTAAWDKINHPKYTVDVSTAFGKYSTATVETTISIDTVDVAKSMFKLMETTVANCPSFMEDGSKITYTHGLAPDVIGDQSEFYYMKQENGPLQFEATIFTSRSGGKIWTWSCDSRASSVDIAQIKSISQLALTKWRAAINQ